MATFDRHKSHLQKPRIGRGLTSINSGDVVIGLIVEQIELRGTFARWIDLNTKGRESPGQERVFS